MNKFTFVFFALAVAGSVCVASSSHSLETKIFSSALACIKENHVYLADVLAIWNQKVTDKNTCLLACILRRIGLLNEEGKFIPDAVYSGAEQLFSANDDILGKAKQIIKRCATVNDINVADGKKGCVRAKLAFNCIIENARDLGVTIKV